MGRADFQYRNGNFTLVKYTLIPINLKKPVTDANGSTRLVHYTSPITEHPEMLALLQPYQQFGQAKLLVPVGSIDAKLEGDRTVVRKTATNLGVLIGHANMAKTRSDFAVVNSGGIRDSVQLGTVTYKDVLKVQPFGNTLATLSLTGAEVLDYLHAAVRMNPGAGGFAHFSGVKMVITGDKADQVRINGAPIDTNKTYRMVINSFMAVGGDGYPNMTSHASYVNTGFVDADVLRSFLTDNSPLQTQRFAPGNHVIYTAAQ